MSSRDRQPDRSVEVCREFIRQRCDRSEGKCRYAHPPSHCHVINGRVTCCVDSIKVTTSADNVPSNVFTGRCVQISCTDFQRVKIDVLDAMLDTFLFGS